ncbi:hypothetical protein B0H17DRAFT_1215152 [Mycena rosella]|uniref:Uncharacterized protein n=1 Tax=Mycena rosella TaxID=1033263 RepID=A0AAD7G284_MYCRO|nr:hypothetical protein B0H17DRAFT_1215152 [Mycena rosella]
MVTEFRCVPGPISPVYLVCWLAHAIVRVSRTWNQIGLELLYEGVRLRRIGQLPAFARALERHDGLGNLVRKLNIDYFVPHRAAELHNQKTRRIFQLCPRLTHFGFKPPFVIPNLLTVLHRVSHTITSLEYNDQMDYHLIFPTLVQLSTSLQSLAICLPAAYIATWHPMVVFESWRLFVGFPALRTFRTLDPTVMLARGALQPYLPHDTHRELGEADSATEDEDKDSPESAWITTILATDPDSDDSEDDD